MTIFYRVYDGLYANITNRCHCACTFCIRQNDDGAYGSAPLWLEHEPSMEEIKEAFSRFNTEEFSEIVFCGYGEPTERLDVLLDTAAWIRTQTNLPIRLNTNGLSDLINGQPTAHRFEGLFDVLSISLNGPTAEEYTEVTRPSFGEKAYAAMLTFASAVKRYVPEVVFTVVDVIGPEKIAESQRVADSVGIPLRVRKEIR